MPRRRFVTKVRSIAALMVLLAAMVPYASGASIRIEVRRLSGATPFPRGCGVPGEHTPSSEAEPSIAVNPKNPKNVIVSWQQDRFPVDGGALTHMVAYSRNAGRTWRTILDPKLSRCTGGMDERASDPWLSIGPDGVAYLASLTFSETPLNPYVAGPTKLVSQTSRDGGATWTPPVDVQPFDRTYNDREAVTADPTRPGSAYYVFVKRLGAFGESGPEMFSKTTDGGKTWSIPVPILVPPPLTLTDPTLITVLPDGTLLNFVLVANLSPFLPDLVPRVPWVIVSTRSTDAGQTWSLPTVIATLMPSAPIDPDGGDIVRAYNLISVDVGPDGTAYVAWNETTSPRSSAIWFARSSDGGETWSDPQPVARAPGQSFIASIAVDGRGTVGVMFDDFRRDKAGDRRLTTDVWFARSTDKGRTWSLRHVAGPFDALSAPESESSGVAGHFLGDYQSLDGLPQGFIGAFVMAKPAAAVGPSDIFIARISG